MIATDRSALICDLAETYHIYDYTRVPVNTLGILCAGLREDSRIRQKQGGVKASLTTILTAQIYDMVSILVWMNTKDGEKGRNQPKPFAKTLIDDDEPKTASFATGAEYEAARKKIIEKIKGAEQ